MTVHRCPGCGAQAAGNAGACGQCGYPLGRGPASRAERRQRGWGRTDARVALGVVAVIVWFVMRSGGLRSAMGEGGRERPGRSEPAPALDADSRALLAQAYSGIFNYRWEHRKNPAAAELSAMVTRSPQSRYALRIRSADEYGVCVQAVPANASGPARLSMDQDGYVYANAACSGETIYHFGR
jgi:hypothetical protein